MNFPAGFPPRFETPPPGFPASFHRPPPGFNPRSSDWDKDPSLQVAPDVSTVVSLSVSDPYEGPDSRRRLRDRVAANRIEWRTSSSSQRHEFSDSEFSDASVASTDAFYRTEGFRYANSQERAKEMGKPLGGEARSIGRGRGIGVRATNEDSVGRFSPAPSVASASSNRGLGLDENPTPSRIHRNETSSPAPLSATYGSPVPFCAGQVTYSLNTDIRRAQDVTTLRRDPESADAAPVRPGRRHVGTAHKKYDPIDGGRTLESLIVALSSKAKREDEHGRQYYVKDEILPIDEDQCHEFKGHRSFADDEMPERSRGKQGRGGSRKPVSSALNAFLNSQRGGTIYLGVLDTGAIKGFILTQYQIDHVRGQLQDLFTRYNPPVLPHRYQLSFVPVLEGIDLEAEIASLGSFEKESHLETGAKKRHKFRTPHYCWCDKDAVALLEFGRLPSQYIVEVEIFAWNPDDPRNVNPFGPRCPNIAPTHEDEMGRVYFRRNASNYCPLVSEVVEYAKQQVDSFYLNLLEKGGLFDNEEEKGRDDDGVKTRLGLNLMERTVQSLDKELPLLKLDDGTEASKGSDVDSGLCLWGSEIESGVGSTGSDVNSGVGLRISENGWAEMKEVDRLLLMDDVVERGET